MGDFGDEGTIPLTGNGSARQSSRFVVDQEEIIVRPIYVIQPEIDDGKAREARVLQRGGRQPAVVESVVHLTVDQVRHELVGRNRAKYMRNFCQSPS